MNSTLNPSTGPRTDAGKARSSRNSLKSGLFAAHDFIFENERDEYAQTLTGLFAELKPETTLEETFTAEIMSANWRLRRCGLIEAALATRELTEEQLAAEQKSVDRARALSHTLLRRSLAELRKLQTERAIRAEIDMRHLPGMADSRQVLKAITAYDRHHAWQTRTSEAQAKTPPLDDIFAQMAQADAALGMTSPVNSSFCKTTNAAPAPMPSTPRNALCPCRSGEKFKRCCGKDAPPVLHTAA